MKKMLAMLLVLGAMMFSGSQSFKAQDARAQRPG